MDEENPSTHNVLRALANEKRMQIMKWLLDPRTHFPPQRDGHLVTDGVCVGAIVAKIGLSQPTVTNHLRIMADAELVTYRPIKNWVFYMADRVAILKALENLRIQFEG